MAASSSTFPSEPRTPSTSAFLLSNLFSDSTFFQSPVSLQLQLVTKLTLEHGSIAAARKYLVENGMTLNKELEASFASVQSLVATFCTHAIKEGDRIEIHQALHSVGNKHAEKEPSVIETLLDNNLALLPILLTEKVTLTDSKDRIIHGTALQNVFARQEYFGHHIAIILVRYFEKMPGGDSQIASQLLEGIGAHAIRGNTAEICGILSFIHGLKQTSLLNTLLTEKITIPDYSGRLIHGTLLQFALGAENVTFRNDNFDDPINGLAEIIMNYFRHIPYGNTKMTAQINEQFPAGWEEQAAKRMKSDSEALHQIFTAIANSQEGDDCETALEAFRNYLNTELKNRINTGKHFNIELLNEAFHLYEEYYAAFGGWDSRKNNLFWEKVIGFIQRFLPVSYAQVLCAGSLSALNSDITFQTLGGDHTLLLSRGEGCYFPLDSDPSHRLGFHYGICPTSLRAQLTEKDIYHSPLKVRNLLH